jgi:LPXTG-motif cell wall-anchored protein
MMRALRLAVALTVAALVTIGFAGAASAITADYPTEACAATTDVDPGETVELECTGFPPGTTVTVSLDAEVLGEVVVADDGSVVFDFPAPACGTYTLSVSDGTTTQSTTLTVACAVSAAGTLPYTGTDSSLPLVQIGAGLLAAGALIMLTVRKRHTLAPAKVER